MSLPVVSARSQSTERRSRGRLQPGDRRRDAADRRVGVLAVLVVHDGARWLPDVLAGLARQTRRPDAVVVVDTGSTDGSLRLVEQAASRLPPLQIVSLARRCGYGEAVMRALATTPEPGWIWLLHDDSAPDPEVLQRLLDCARDCPSAALLGGKLVGWRDPGRLIEVGVTVDRAGRRYRGVDRGERDQGQRDRVRDVLAVSTAGALLRRSALEEIGGLEPALPLAGDDVDLGWRLRAAGHRVLVVPTARLRHADAVRAGLRSAAMLDTSFAAADRRHGLWTVLVNVSAARLTLLVPAVLVAGLLRAVALLLVRRTPAARVELHALAGTVLRPRSLRAARARRRHHRVPHADGVRRLLAGPGERVQRARDRLSELAPTAPAPLRVVSDQQAELGPGDEDDELPDVRGGWARGLLRHPGVAVVGALTLLVAVAGRDLLIGAALGRPAVGGALVAAPDLGRLWSIYLADWHVTGPGTAAAAPAYLPILGLLALPLGGSVALATVVLLLGSIPLAAATAYYAAGRLTRTAGLRAWAAVTYALLPAAVGAVVGGRLDQAVGIALLPLVVVGAADLGRRPEREVVPAAFRLALLLAVVGAFVPLALPLTAVGLLAGELTRWAGRGGVRGRLAAGRVAAALVVPLAAGLVLLPWILTVARHPLLLVTGGTGGGVLRGGAPSTGELLLVFPGGPGLPPPEVTAGLLVMAALGLLRAVDRRAVRGLWLLAAGATVAAAALLRLRLTGPGGPALVASPWVGLPLALAGAGLLGTVLAAVSGLRTRLGTRGFGWRQAVVVVLTVTVLAAPVVGALAVLRHTSEMLRAPAVALLPPFATAELGPDERVLALRADNGGVGYAVTGPAGAVLGAARLPVPDPAARQLDAVVSDLVADRGVQAAPGLAAFGVRMVVAPTADQTLRAALDAQTGLTRDTYVGPQTVWRVVPQVPKVAVLPVSLALRVTAGSSLDPDAASAVSGLGSTTGTTTRGWLPAGAAGRLLVLTEAANPGWQARLDGEPLPATTAYGWAQAFVLPARAGEVTVDFHAPGHRALLWLQLAAVVGVALLGVPAPAPTPQQRYPRSRRRGAHARSASGSFR